LDALTWEDQSTADPVEKARRVLLHLIEPTSAYFFDDGFPRPELRGQVKNVLVVLEALAASPAAPAQSGGVAPLSVMRAAFRVTEAEGNPDPKKRRFHMRFTFRSMDELHSADDQWRIFSNAAPQPSQPVEAGEPN
jgi:hypothetical protein